MTPDLAKQSNGDATMEEATADVAMDGTVASTSTSTSTSTGMPDTNTDTKTNTNTNTNGKRNMNGKGLFPDDAKDKAKAAAGKAKDVAVQQLRKAINTYIIKNMTTTTTTTTTTMMAPPDAVSTQESNTELGVHPDGTDASPRNMTGLPILDAGVEMEGARDATIIAGATNDADAHANTLHESTSNGIASTQTTTVTSTTGWHFRSLFLVEITLLPVVIFSVSLIFWILNRQTHIRPTKGSRINYKRRKQRRLRRRRNRQKRQLNNAITDLSSPHSEQHSDYDADDSCANEYSTSNGATDDDDDDDDDGLDSDHDSAMDPENHADDSSTSSADSGAGDVARNERSLAESPHVRLDMSAMQDRRGSTSQDRRKSIIRQSRRRSRRQSYQTLLRSHITDQESDEDVTITTEMDAASEHDVLLQFSDFGQDDFSDDDWNSDDNHHARAPESAEASSSFASTSRKQLELYKLMKKFKIFAYLNADAMKICIQQVQMVQLEPHEVLFDNTGDKPLDGSLYAVMSGKVRCRFHSMKLPHDEPTSPEDLPEYPGVYGVTREAGQMVTSLVTMLAGMVQHEKMQHDDPQSDVLDFAHQISVAASDEPVQLIRVPPSCFSQICQMFPTNVHRIAQTILLQAQRLTTQCLINTLGMRKELLQTPTAKVHSDRTLRRIAGWKKHTIHDAKANKQIFHEACDEFLTHFGIASSANASALVKATADIVTLSEPNETLIQAGDNHEYCYLLLRGSVESGILVPHYGQPTMTETGEMESALIWTFTHHETLNPGDILGEYVCFTHDLSMFTVRNTKTTAAASLLRIPRRVFHSLLMQNPSHVMVLSLESILQRIPSAVHLLLWSCNWHYAESADTIVTEGMSCDSMYVVLNGRLRASHSGDRKMVHDGVKDKEFGRGKMVGKVECLTSGHWPFDLYAIRKSEFVSVPLRTMLVIINEHPSAGLYFARAIASQIQQTNKAGKPKMDAALGPLPSYGLKVATVAVIPLMEDTKDCGTLLRHMVAAFGKNAPCRLLTKQIVKSAIGAPPKKGQNALYDVRMTRFLADMEENNRLVLYKADARYTWWTKVCIQQADSILVLVDANKAPDLGRLKQSLVWAFESMHVRIDLVVVGQDDEEQKKQQQRRRRSRIRLMKKRNEDVAEDLNTWSEKRKWIAGHHLIRKPFSKHQLDFARMSRRVCGNSLGLVLGGGGARGLAHLGVYRALLELGVTVDIVGGTSQGAFVGALLAQHPDNYDFMYAACRDMSEKMSSVQEKLFDLTLPMVSTFSGFMFSRTIRKLLGPTKRVQDLALEFFCVSVDLLKPEQLVHRKGCLWKYVQASMSLSGYLPPVAEDGKYLVDGGYMNALPADVMRNTMGAKTVISIDVSPESEREYHDYGTSLSGWWLLWNSLNPFAKTVVVPSMMDLNGLLVWASSDHHMQRVKSFSDLDLMPPVGHIGTLEYDKFEEIVETSYQFAKPLLAKYVEERPWLVEGSNGSGTSNGNGDGDGNGMEIKQ